MLRTKTLLGETYIELTPGSRQGPELADGATLPEANVAESVQLDEIFRTFNARTRAAFQEWMRESAVAINGQGQNLSYALGSLEPTFTELDKLFRVLDSQRLAVGQLFRNGATTFTALRGQNGELANLIRSSDAVFSTTADRDRDIEALFRAFPTFLDESRLTFSQLKGFSENADPLMCQLVPAAEQLSPTLIALSKLAPESKAFFEGLGPVIKLAPTGFTALRKLFRDEFPPLLRAIDPFIRNLNPILVGLKLYKSDFAAFFANLAATFHGQLAEPGNPHYLRVVGGLNPETLSVYPRRLTINRNSPYSPPKWAEGLVGGLPSFDTRQCTTGITAVLEPKDWESEAFKERASPTKKAEEEAAKKEEEGKPDEAAKIRNESRDKNAQLLFERIQQYAFAGKTSTSEIAAPPCKQQRPFEPIYGSGPDTQYQHAFEQPQP